jgi:hypothetical protein
MKKEDPIPRMREDLEIIPTSYKGEKAVLVRDFLGLIREPVILQGDALHVLGLIDGHRTIRDIHLELVRMKRGVLMDGDLIDQLVRDLDSAYLLQSRQFLEGKEKILSEYAHQDVRAPSHAGISYPARPEELQAYIESVLHAPGEMQSAGEGQICGLIAPHIDLEVGRKVYAKAYQSVRHIRPRRIILLGTGHNLDESFYSLTEKDFLTPLGRVASDRGAIRALKKAGGDAVSSFDIAHRGEHSLEFQLLFLQYLFGSSFTVVPVLCGSFAGELKRAARPAEIAGVREFLAALKAWREQDAPRTLVVAGVDFSHIGPKFGHRERASSLLLEAKNHDLALIEALSASDVHSFWAESQKVGDRYNVCGFSAMSSLLEILPKVKGRLLDYACWREEATQSAVSYAAILFQAEN